MASLHRSEPPAALAGPVVAQALGGSWRQRPPAPALSVAQLSSVTPHLLASGAGALAWWRARHSEEVRSSNLGRRLHDAYRAHALHAALHERRIVAVLSALRSAGVAPLLVKGWAAARLYPRPGLRPYGDIDLCIRADQAGRVKALLSRLPEGRAVDLLHDEELDGPPLDELLGRAAAARLGGIEVSIPSPEDHLRVLCLHFLKHGGWRPLWLCDVAAAVEGRPADFDWALCLTGDHRRADWVCSVIALCHLLLGADVEGSPAAGGAGRLPRWMVSSVLRRWAHPWPEPLGESMPSPRRPREFLRGLIKRWRAWPPDPVAATFNMGGALREGSRLPYQVGVVAKRTLRYLSWRRPAAG